MVIQSLPWVLATSGNRPSSFLGISKFIQDLGIALFILLLSGSSLYKLNFKILQLWLLCCLNLHPVCSTFVFLMQKILIWKDNLLV